MNEAKLKLECDVVMKGGITSGVIYPRLVSKLAETYTFRSIGGTSAGAIAAGAAAAAQLGVLSGAHPMAFEQLSNLPDLLGGPVKGASGSMLLNLFQPQRLLHRHFGVLTGVLNAKSKLGLVLLLAWGAVRRFIFGALLGSLPGVAILATSHGIGWAVAWLITVAGLVGGAFAAAILSFGSALPKNTFGMCTGLPNGKRKVPALTSWLNEYLNELAGKAAPEPLTFGELWAGHLRQPGANNPYTADGPKAIELATMTTALNLGRPFRMPFESAGFYFLEDELRAFFPKAVVDWMIAHSRPSDTATDLSASGGKFYSLPEPQDLPVLIAIRMSLSFPILLSAVPLYTIDYSLKVKNSDARTATRVLFSDGGICSNFPIQFFDSPLPSRPTFGIDLGDFHPDYKEERVWLPEPLKNGEGIRSFIPQIAETPGISSVVGFVSSIVNTMQCWNDQLQLVMPGFRDRVIHIAHSKDEGGLNLNMPAATITVLANSGRDAANVLEKAFAKDPSPNAWDNHRRVRVRSLLSGINKVVGLLHRAIDNVQVPSWRGIVEEEKPPSYTFSSARQRELAVRVLESLDALGAELKKELEESGTDLSKGAPRPEPEWRAVPRV